MILLIGCMMYATNSFIALAPVAHWPKLSKENVLFCLFCFVVSAVHFAPYLTGLSSMMLI